MKSNFIISAFADEISPVLATQLKHLKAHGITHIELRSIAEKNISEYSLAELAPIKVALREAGIRVSSIGSPIGKIQIDEPFEPHLELFRHVIDIAEFFDSEYIRMFSFYLPRDANPDDYHDEVVTKWKRFLVEVQGRPVTLLHENEKDIYGDTIARCEKLLADLEHPQVQAAFDPANFVQCGEEVYPAAYEALRPRIGYVHIKDALANGDVRPAGHGIGNIPKVLAALVTSDYQGFLSLEPHLTIFPGFAQLEKTELENEAPTAVEEGIRTFSLAATSLKEIIAAMDQTWR